jgi:fermentation-respiration switch protein FrsA (DUF1100 family)
MDLKVLLLLAVGGYLGITGLVWYAQERLIFYPRAAAAAPQAPAGWNLDDVEVATRDGTRVRGSLLRPPLERAPLVIYYGGNAEEVTEGAGVLARDHGLRALLLVNYRGYGRSEGVPSEKALLEDALEIYDWAVRQPGIDPERVAVHGRSLGSGVAVAVAAARPVRCVLLTTPFASALDLAREFYPWLPVGILLRHRFDSAALAPKIERPLLVLSANEDTIVKPHHAEKLVSLWRGPVDHRKLAGFGHNDLQLAPEYARAIGWFLDEHLK